MSNCSQISRLALGTVQFGMDYGIANRQGQVDLTEAIKIISVAKSEGIDALDTAIGYGDSELVLGEVGCNSFQVTTKLPSMPTYDLNIESWVREQIQGSLSRLKRGEIYGLLLHNPVELLSTGGQDLYKSICRLREDGVVQKIGVSVYSPEELNRLLDNFEFGIVQIPFNIFDRRLLSSGILRKLAEKKIEVHVRSVFLQGLLLMKQQDIPLKFQRWSILLEEWQTWLNEGGISALQACLEYVLSIKEIDRVILGANSCNHLHEIVAVANKGAPSALDFPSFRVGDERLINPALWSSL